MATFPSNVKIPKATEHFSTFDLSCDHITTQDFFKLKPVYSRVLVPGQSINVEMSHISRLAPLNKPFYGSVTMTNRAFFVPFRCIMEGFNEFITDTPYVTSGGAAQIISSVPTLKMSTICELLKGSSYSSVITSGQPDFVAKDSSDKLTPYRYTPFGRYAVDILNCLGYQVDWSSLFNTSGVGNISLSAIPLLVFVKIYVDYFENTNFAPLSNLQRLFKGVNKVLTADDFNYLFTSALYASYENDYLTSSWSNPTSPYNSVQSSFFIPDATLDKTANANKSAVFNGSGTQTPFIANNGGDGTTTTRALTTYILTALQSLSDYMKRHQISGYRAVDRFRARFGITLPDANLNRAVYLGKQETPIEITDVTSTADTTNAILGQYSGFGISRNGNSGSFSFKTDEYGMFMILSIISPIHASYANGIDRHLLDTTKLDLYTPEFDGLGCQGIAKCEIKGDFATVNTEQSPLTVWAYTPRYAHYKCSRDVLSGDFKLQSKFASMKNFHIFRNFLDGDGVPSHNLNFCTGHPDDYTRIFNDTSTNSDHFFTAFHFRVKSSAPMSPLFENYHFDESGAPVEQKVGGTRLS